MKLTSQTKDLIQIGTVLKDSFSVYTVSNLWKAGRSIYITLTDESKRNLYGLTVSSCYGMEIK